METIIKTQQFESTLSQRTLDYLTFIDFISEQADDEGNLIVTRQEEMDRFKASNDIDREMKITAYVQANEFSDKFAEITGIDELKFESCFISSKYIDTYTYNTMNLIVKTNGKNERFIIDCV